MTPGAETTEPRGPAVARSGSVDVVGVGLDRDVADRAGFTGPAEASVEVVRKLNSVADAEHAAAGPDLRAVHASETLSALFGGLALSRGDHSEQLPPALHGAPDLVEGGVVRSEDDAGDGGGCVHVNPDSRPQAKFSDGYTSRFDLTFPYISVGEHTKAKL